jgi:hypothetical protein
MVSLLLRISCLVGLLSRAFAARGTIDGVLQFPDKSIFNETARILLNHGEFATYSGVDGSFSIPNVPPGIHVLDVHSHVYHFSQVKIMFPEDAMESPKCLEYAYPGAKKNPIDHPLVLSAIATYDYFEVRRGFSIFSLLRNPMVIMMLFSVVLMYFLPTMMENMEPEERERMKQQMAMQNDPSKMLGQLFSGGEPEPKKKLKK